MSMPAQMPGGCAPSLGEGVAQRQMGHRMVAPAQPPGGHTPSHGKVVAQRQAGCRPLAPARLVLNNRRAGP